MELIALCIITGHDGHWLQHKSVAIGIKGELDQDGEQTWYDTMETLCQFHPEAKDAAA